MGQSRLDDLARKAGKLALNPIDERNRDGEVPSLGDTADEVRESLSAGFRNEHMAQWKSTLETYGASLRAKPVDTITTDDVLAAISRAGPLRPKLPLGCAGGLRRSWMPRKPSPSAKARILRGGVAIWTTFCQKPSKLARGLHLAIPYENVAPNEG
jgi:hypothetical protein